MTFREEPLAILLASFFPLGAEARRVSALEHQQGDSQEDPEQRDSQQGACAVQDSYPLYHLIAWRASGQEVPNFEEGFDISHKCRKGQMRKPGEKGSFGCIHREQVWMLQHRLPRAVRSRLQSRQRKVPPDHRVPLLQAPLQELQAQPHLWNFG